MRATLTAALVLGASALCGWTPARDPSGRALRWPDDAWPLPLADADLTWARAAALWTDVADVGFRPVPAAEAGPDGVVALTTVTDAESWAAIVGDESTVGFTVFTSDAEGALEDADVYLNAARFRFADPPERGAYATAGVLRHELGHVLGLGHSCGAGIQPCSALDPDDPAALALMFPQVGPADVRAPNDDDLAGVAAQISYPRATRRARLEGVIAEGPRRWRVALTDFEPGDTLRAWTQTPVIATIEATDDGVGITTRASPPLTLEVWTANGQGRVFTDALMAADEVTVGPERAPVTDDAAGCRQAPSPPWLFGLLMIARRRRVEAG